MANYDPTVLSPKDRVDAASAPRAPAPQLPDAPKVIGDFRVARRAGAGAMGEVLLATHRTSGQEVAIKVVSGRLADDPDFHERFRAEIEALIKLDHPNVARAIAYGVDRGRPWLAMQFVRGPSLADLQRQIGALPEPVALRVAIQIASGLAHVHAKGGLVHRDIKPSNVLIAVEHGPRDADGQEQIEHVAKIIDFGLVKSADGQSDMGLTMPGMVVGTPYFMSPEQIGGGHVDLRGDIYSLGATLFRLLTDVPPYEGTSQAVVIAKHLTAPVPDPGDRVQWLHAGTRALTMRALAKDPAERFASYPDFIAACEAALAELRAQGIDLDGPLVIDGVRECPVTLPVLDDPTEDPFAPPPQGPQLDAVVYVDTPSLRGRPQAQSVSELDGGFGADRAVERTPLSGAAAIVDPGTTTARRGSSSTSHAVGTRSVEARGTRAIAAAPSSASEELRKVQTKRIQRLQHDHLSSRHVAAVRAKRDARAGAAWRAHLHWRSPWLWAATAAVAVVVIVIWL